MCVCTRQFLWISRYLTIVSTPLSPCLPEEASGRCSGPLGQFSSPGCDAKTDTTATDPMGKLRTMEIILRALVRHSFAGSVSGGCFWQNYSTGHHCLPPEIKGQKVPTRNESARANHGLALAPLSA